VFPVELPAVAQVISEIKASGRRIKVMPLTPWPKATFSSGNISLFLLIL
jgi:hypothetical protein